MGKKRCHDEVSPMEIDGELIVPKTSKRRKYIPVALKRLAWYNLFTKEVGQRKCPVCNAVDITQLDFECAHIVSEFNGGPTAVNNLIPLCNHCNKSMSKRNVVEYVQEFYPFNTLILQMTQYVQSLR